MNPEWEFPHYLECLFEPQWRYIVLKGGRGGTKSWSAARSLLIRGYENPLRVLCVREVQRSIKESVHQLLSDQIQRLGLSGFYDVLTNEIRGKNGTKFAFTGLSNLTADALKSYEGFDVAWCEEAHKLSQRSVDLLLPTIRKPGSQIIFTFNPELDTDEVWVRFIENTPDNCVVRDCSYHNNPWFPEVLEEERQEFLRMVESGARSKEDYDWVWEGKTKPAVDGAIFARQVAQTIEEGRLCHVPHNPQLYTHLVWDLGYSGMMTIGFVQRSADSVRLIDYIEDSHRTYDSYVSQIRDKVSQHGYRIALDGKQGGKAWLPHDGKQTRPEIGKSPIQLLNELGLHAPTEGIPGKKVERRIELARQMFPRVSFDKEKCSGLFNRLRRYAMKHNAEDHTTTIKKDGNDHAGDMFTEIAVIEPELTNAQDEMMGEIQYDDTGII